MSPKAMVKRVLQAAQSNHAAKEFEEVAERIFRDDSSAEALFSIEPEHIDDDLDTRAA